MKISSVFLLLILLTLPFRAMAGLDDIISAESTQVSYSLLHRGEPIGLHTVMVKKSGNQLVVDHALDVTYKIGFVTLYDMHHKSHEVWEESLTKNAELVGFTSDTEENGNSFSVRGGLSPEGFRISSPTGESLTTSGLTTTNSLWNIYWAEKSPEYPEMIDSIDGGIQSTQIEPAGPENLQGKQTSKYIVRTDLSKAEGWFYDKYLFLAIVRRGGFQVHYEKRPIPAK